MRCLSDDQLTQLAGASSFKRGLGYFRDGRVHLLRATESGFDAEAEGTETYRLRLWREDRDWAWNCDCPAGGFCKHLVAAALAWREGEREPAKTQDALLEFLQAQTVERLAQWLRELADEDPAIEKRLKLLAAQDDPAQLKKSVRAMLSAPSFLDWRRSNVYAQRLTAVLRLLTAQLGRDPQLCLSLCGDALDRLLKVYGRSDDSGGALGARLAQFAALHRQAVAAAAATLDRRRLARDLLVLHTADEWDFFPIEDYWNSLGDDGQAQYAKLVEAKYAALPAPGAQRGTGPIEHFAILHRMERLAGLRRDFDALQSVLMRDLSSGRAYERLVQACREFGREREALQWAERGVKAHPDWHGLRSLLAEELQRAGLNDEAVEMLWLDFRKHPAEAQWLRLKAASDASWPAFRQRALDHLRQKERSTPDGRPDASQRLELLMADGDLDAARELANNAAAWPSVLQALAARIEPRHPLAAASLLRRATDAELPAAGPRDYERLAERMARVLGLAAGADTLAWIADIKSRYRARRKFLSLIAARGL